MLYAMGATVLAGLMLGTLTRWQALFFSSLVATGAGILVSIDAFPSRMIFSTLALMTVLQLSFLVGAILAAFYSGRVGTELKNRNDCGSSVRVL